MFFAKLARMAGLLMIGTILLLAPLGSGQAAETWNGVIEGSLSYPSDFIPPDMTVCAENLTTQQRYCTQKHLKGQKYTYKVGYKLKVPPGDYQVYAYLPDPAKYGAGFPRDYRAYYSKFVKCGMSVNCKDHSPITVRVKRGKVVSGIDPMDWYR
jgi:hypothetical protein